MAFVLSGGKLTPETKKTKGPLPPKPLFLGDVWTQYLDSYPPGSKEASTLGTEKTHVGHLTRILGSETEFVSLSLAMLQVYANKRSREVGHTGRR